MRKRKKTIVTCIEQLSDNRLADEATACYGASLARSIIHLATEPQAKEASEHDVTREAEKKAFIDWLDNDPRELKDVRRVMIEKGFDIPEFFPLSSSRSEVSTDVNDPYFLVPRPSSSLPPEQSSHRSRRKHRKKLKNSDPEWSHPRQRQGAIAPPNSRNSCQPLTKQDALRQPFTLPKVIQPDMFQLATPARLKAQQARPDMLPHSSKHPFVLPSTKEPGLALPSRVSSPIRDQLTDPRGQVLPDPRDKRRARDVVADEPAQEKASLRAASTDSMAITPCLNPPPQHQQHTVEPGLGRAWEAERAADGEDPEVVRRRTLEYLQEMDRKVEAWILYGDPD